MRENMSQPLELKVNAYRGISFFIMTREKIFEESGKKGESFIEEILEENYKRKYIHNYLLRFYGFIQKECSAEIDFVLVLNKYVYLLEIKHYNCITGYNSKKDEYHVLINKNSRHFKSPVYQNENHRILISKLLDIAQSDIVCISIIITDDDSERKFVSDISLLQGGRNHVIRKNKLIGLLSKYENHSKPDLNRDNLFEKFECTDFSKDERAQKSHIDYCNFFNKHKELNKYRMKFYACKNCGEQLVLREKNGEFFAGCVRYPVCASKTVPLANIDAYEISQNDIKERVIYRMSLDEYREEKQNLIDEINRLEKRKDMYPESIIGQKCQEIEELEGKISEVNTQINKIQTEYRALKENYANQKKQLEQQSCELKAEKILNEQLNQKLSKTLAARLRRLIGLKE